MELPENPEDIKKRKPKRLRVDKNKKRIL